MRRTVAGAAAGPVPPLVVALVVALATVPPPTAATAPAAPPVPGALVPLRPAAVLPGLDAAAAVPGRDPLAAALDPVLAGAALGPSVSAEVVDLADGRSLLSRSADRAAAPASTAKILTAAAVLSLRGPQDRLATRVVSGDAGEIVLVGGGDVLLAPGRGRQDSVIGHAGLDDLAAATVSALRSAGRTSVTVRLDDTAFAGPARSPDWSGGDVAGGFVAPVTALALDSGNATPGRRTAPGHPFPRAADPAMAAATTFVTRLRAHGMAVTGGPTRASAPAGAEQVAEVLSAPLADLVEEALTESDNTVAEALARLTAASSNLPTTFSGAGRAVLERIGRLGVEVTGQTMAGGSGLGSGYAIGAHTLVRVLALAASPEHPELRPVLTGLPIAGASGTLAERFAATATRPAVGVVRAKTGTLTGVSALAGTVVDADGRQLGFAVLADRVPATEPARAALDRTAAALARCGCG